MIKNKLEIVLLAVVMLFCIVFISSCGNNNLIEDSEYMAVRVVNRLSLTSWSFDVKGLKVEIKNNKLFIDDEEMGTLSAGKVSQDRWSDLIYYDAVEGVDLDTLMTIENCFVIDSKTSIYGADYFYLISNSNNYYLLFATKQDNKMISSVYLLD